MSTSAALAALEKRVPLDWQRKRPGDALETELVEWVRASYPDAEYQRIMSQEYCELDDFFLGFLDVYYAASLIATEATTVIDFGCNLAAQAALFEHCRAYVGVDTSRLERFKTANSRHSVMSIQDFIAQNPGVAGRADVLAVCSYVPDTEARTLVNATFPTVVNFYPHSALPNNPMPDLFGVTS